jgi:hypothetical protein
MLGDCQVDNIFPSIIFRDLRMQGDMRRYRDTGGLQRLGKEAFQG